MTEIKMLYPTNQKSGKPLLGVRLVPQQCSRGNWGAQYDRRTSLHECRSAVLRGVGLPGGKGVGTDS